MNFITKSLAQTINLGEYFARSLKGGEIIIAYGDLGAGKTAFAKGLAKGLKVKQIVNSPTFNIMKVYQGDKLNFYHIDAYRLEDKNAVSDIGLDEVIGNQDGICFVEWPQFISFLLKDGQKVYTLHFKQIDLNTRMISFKEGYYGE